jgi:hypothetical protein
VLSGALRDVFGWNGAWLLYAALAAVAGGALIVARERLLKGV